MSPRSRYGRQWSAWRFMISRSESVRLWAKSGRGAMRRRTKVGMPRTLRPLLVAIEYPTPTRGRQLARRNAPDSPRRVLSVGPVARWWRCGTEQPRWSALPETATIRSIEVRAGADDLATLLP